MVSQSDWPTLEKSVQTLDKFGVSEAKVVSAHRTPDLLFDYAKNAESRGLKCLIAGAGGAAHLPGMAASMTSFCPCWGFLSNQRLCKVWTHYFRSFEMPAGIPTATFAIGEAGAINAALFAVSILASAGNEELLQKIKSVQG